MVKMIKGLIKNTIICFLSFLVWSERNITKLKGVSNIVLILRPDNIGDYILFRNFIKVLKESSQYKGYIFWLAGNIVFSNLAESLDRQYIDRFIWMKPEKYLLRGGNSLINIISILHTIKINSILYSKKYHTLIYPVYSRISKYDILCLGLLALNKITMKGDNANKENNTDLYNEVYSNIVPVNTEPGIFEFYRNREFISNLLHEDNQLAKPFIEKMMLPKPKITLPEQYVVIHMDASDIIKEWPEEYFKQITLHIIQKYNLSVVLLGLKDRGDYFTEIMAFEGITNLYNKTNLLEAAAILSKAILFIGNDSGLFHIAAATGVNKGIILCNGQHYGRFVPYPDSLSTNNFYFLFPPVIKDIQKNQSDIKAKYADGSYENITTIKPEKILKFIDNILTSQSKENSF